MHFECEALYAMLASVFRGVLPVRNDFFFPLPVLHLGVFGGPAIGDPVGLGVLRSAARTAGKADDDFYIEDFGEEHGLAERVDIFLSVLEIGMNGIAVTTERGDVNSAVFKFFLPCFGFGSISDEIVEWAMRIVRIASRADLHDFHTQRGDSIQHGIEGEVVIYWLKSPDDTLPHLATSLGMR